MAGVEAVSHWMPSARNWRTRPSPMKFQAKAVVTAPSPNWVGTDAAYG